MQGHGGRSRAPVVQLRTHAGQNPAQDFGLELHGLPEEEELAEGV